MRSRKIMSGGATLILTGLLTAATFARAEQSFPPVPAHWVTDRSAFLSAAAAEQLDARLGDFSRRTGHQVLVYIDRTTGGVPIEEWAVKAFAQWRVGRKEFDDGVVLFIFTADRKLRIEVGYGLEDRLPDARASRIINERIVPRIRTGDADGAVRDGVAAILAALGDDGEGAAPTTSDPDPAARTSTISGWKVGVLALVLLALLGFGITHPSLAWLLLMSIGSGRGQGGNGFGGGFGGGGGSSSGGGFSGGGGRSGGGGASGSW